MSRPRTIGPAAATGSAMPNEPLRAIRAIALVGPLPPPPGGMANQTRQLGRLLAQDGLDVRLVQTNAAVRPRSIASVRGLRALFRLVPYVRALWNGLDGADVVHVMANSGWAWHLCAAPAVWLAVLRRVPVVVNYRGGEAAAFLDRQHRVVRPTLRRADLLVVPSGFLGAVFSRHGFASVEVPNIVDLEAFHPAPEPATQPHIVVARNLEPIYDNATALRAFARVRAIHASACMTIAGDGPERQALHRLADELGLGDAVRFTGRLDNARLPELYRSARLSLNPSTVDNMPISVLESLACGVPVVSTNVGGIPHIVEHERSALLVPPRDDRAMADAMLRLLHDAELAARLRRAGPAVTRRYAWAELRPALMAAYAKARAAYDGRRLDVAEHAVE